MTMGGTLTRYGVIDTRKFYYNGTLPLKKLASECRLFICTYNAMTYNESLAANIPTIIFWDTEFWEPKKFAENDFNALKSLEYFMTTPNQLQIKNRIWKMR